MKCCVQMSSPVRPYLFHGLALKVQSVRDPFQIDFAYPLEGKSVLGKHSGHVNGGVQQLRHPAQFVQELDQGFHVLLVLDGLIGADDAAEMAQQNLNIVFVLSSTKVRQNFEVRFLITFRLAV